MRLYQRKKTGKIKFIQIYSEADSMITKWGELDPSTLEEGKVQETKKVCLPTNAGKQNELDGSGQAAAEVKAKIEKKMREGYSEDINLISETTSDPVLLSELDRNFCCSKPISKAPAKILDSEETYAQRKRDGHCIILVSDENGEHQVYSRGMENISETMLQLPVVKDFFSWMSVGDMVLTEFCYVKNRKDSTREIAKIVRKKKPEEVMKTYQEACKSGSFEIVPFDIMFSEDCFIGHWSYKERLEALYDISPDVPETFFDWKDKIDYAKSEGWEGFVLRNDNISSQINFTLNGKPERSGCYKFIFTFNDDFVVTSANKGKSGKHSGMYSQFFIGQYNKEGQLLDFGKCGPGKITHEELAEITKDIDSGELKFPFVIQVEYRDQQPDSGKLSFPVFERMRLDKSPEECATDFVGEK